MRTRLIMLIAATTATLAVAQDSTTKRERPTNATEAAEMFRHVAHSLADSIRAAERHCDGKAISAECLYHRDAHGEQKDARPGEPQPGQSGAPQQGEQKQAQADTPTVVCVVTLLTKDNTLTEVRVDAQSGKVIGQRRVDNIARRSNEPADGTAIVHASDVRAGDAGTQRPRDEFAAPRRWQKATDLTGKRVTNSANEDLGTLKNIVVDARSGRILYGVVSFGGFLGLGDKLFAVPWPSLELKADAREFVLDVDRERLKNAEGFDESNWPNFADERWATATYRHYGQPPYWDRPAASTGDADRDRWNQPVTVWQKTTDLCGKDARSAGNEDVGKMIDLAIDPDAGRIIYGILQFEGKLYAVPWGATSLSGDARHFVINVEKNALTGSVAFTNDRWPNLTDQRWAQSTYEVFRVKPYWAVREDR